MNVDRAVCFVCAALALTVLAIPTPPQPTQVITVTHRPLIQTLCDKAGRLEHDRICRARKKSI